MAKQIENVIYILTNPQYPGYVKIGYASNLKQRIASLNTGALVEFEPFAVYETDKQNGDIEIHRIIELLNPILRASNFSNGKGKLKEFFKLEPEEVYELLEHIAIVSGTVNRLYKVDKNLNKILSNDNVCTPPQMVVIDAPVPDGRYTFERKIKSDNMTVKGICDIVSGHIVLKAGCIFSVSEKDSISVTASEIRKKAKLKNHILQKDIEVSSLNEGATVIVGCAVDAWVTWKDSNGAIIDEYRQEKER